MTDHFEFAIPSARLDLPEARAGEAIVDITSRLGRHARVGVEVKPGQGAQTAWFAAPVPAEADIADADTLRVTVPVSVPNDVAAAEHTFTVRAYAIDDPQADFTESPTLTLVIPAPKPPPSTPWWIFAVIAAVVLAVLGVGGYLLFKDDDKAGATAPDVVGATLDAARLAAGALEVSPFSASTVEADTGCVLYQSPETGQPAERLFVFLVECPTPGPTIAPPTGADNFCTAAFAFCSQIARQYGDDLSTDEQWIADSQAMTQRFIERFTVPGVLTPAVVGLDEAKGVAALVAAGFDVSVHPGDALGGVRCVLLQFPFPEVEATQGADSVVVTAPCPQIAGTPENVIVSTDISADLANVCQVVPALCNAAAADPAIGADGVGSDEFVTAVQDQLQRFRNSFIGDVVPDVRGSSLTPAISTLAAAGLGADYETFVWFDDSICYYVVSQSPAPGVPIAELPNNIVTLAIDTTPCLVWRIDQLELNPDLIGVAITLP
jgi:hypothetical protein